MNNTTEISNMLAKLYGANQALDDLYSENEGEVTQETENLEADIEVMKQILTTEGVDDLGRMMMHDQHNIEDLKAVEKHIASKRKFYERRQERIKFLAGQVLRLTGQDKVKGTLGYSFTQYVSDTCKADDAAIKELFQSKAVECLKANGFPEWITCKLSASSSLVPEGTELPEYFTRTITETAKFGKPRSAND